MVLRRVGCLNVSEIHNFPTHFLIAIICKPKQSFSVACVLTILRHGRDGKAVKCHKQQSNLKKKKSVF